MGLKIIHRAVPSNAKQVMLSPTTKPCRLAELGSREIGSKIGRFLLIYIFFYFFSFFQS